MGYEPVTVEEIHEIRLQLKNQPSWEARHRWSYFHSLLMKEEVLRMYRGKEVSEIIYNWDGKSYGIFGVAYQLPGEKITNDLLLIPSEKFRTYHKEHQVNPKFACAIPESRKRVEE